MRTPRIRFLDVEDPTKPVNRVDADPAKRYYRRTLKVPKVLVREPRLLVPRQKPVGVVKAISGKDISYLWLPRHTRDNKELINNRGFSFIKYTPDAGNAARYVRTSLTGNWPFGNTFTFIVTFYTSSTYATIGRIRNVTGTDYVTFGTGATTNALSAAQYTSSAWRAGLSLANAVNYGTESPTKTVFGISLNNLVVSAAAAISNNVIASFDGNSSYPLSDINDIHATHGCYVDLLAVMQKSLSRQQLISFISDCYAELVSPA